MVVGRDADGVAVLMVGKETTALPRRRLALSGSRCSRHDYLLRVSEHCRTRDGVLADWGRLYSLWLVSAEELLHHGVCRRADEEAAYLCQDRRQDDSCRALRIPLLERTEAFGLGLEQVCV